MDIAAHALWAGAGILLARRLWVDRAAANAAPDQPRRKTARTVALTMAMAALPDLIHLLPLMGWVVFGSGTAADLYAYAIASPGQEPLMPPWVTHFAHHLHCIMHSAITTAAATLLLWLVLRTLWIPLLGWWSHVVIDVFSHSAAFYPSPVLYPLTQQGFDGIAWNTPWFMLLNYTVLAAMWAWLGWSLWWVRRRPRGSAPG